MNYELLHNKFQSRKNQLVLDKEEVVDRVLRRYKAIKIDKKEIMDLMNDDQLEYGSIFCCLKIDDVQILNKIFNSKELKDFQWEIEDNKKRKRKYSFKNDEESTYNQLILDEMEGRRIDVVLESLDGKYITGFLVRNQSEEVGSYLFSLVGGAHFSDVNVKNLVVQARELTDEEYKESYRDYLEDLQRWNLI